MSNGDGFFSSVFSGIGDIFSSSSGFGDTLGQIAGTALSTYLGPDTTSLAARPILAPVVRSVGGPLTMMASKFSARFPNLYAVLAASKMAGQSISRSKAWTLLRNYGPSALIGLGFTAEAINELMVAGPGRRRMNVANVKALRRGLRRAEGFNKLACRVQASLATYGRRSTRSSARCRTCRKSPCRC